MRKTGIFSTVFAVCLAALPALSQDNPFAGGWTLKGDGSSISFQSTKNQTKVETSGFATFAGEISETGAAELEIALESVDTGIDLRNVRMRFLFFESFQFPKATISAQIDPAALSDLQSLRRKVIRLPFVLNLHGVVKSAEADVAVTLLTDDLVNVSTQTPITVAAADYNLMEGVKKLEEAAGVTIVPQAAVTFDLTFQRNGQAALASNQTEDANAEAGDDAREETGEDAEDQSAALEPVGNFSAEACKGRFEILSRTDSITFRSRSARLAASSSALLDGLADIVARCPDMVIEIGGHTDSVGSDAANMRLSERRAGSVLRYLTGKGIAQTRLRAVGCGEAEPKFDNATAEGRKRNRRIEFRVIEE